MTLAIRKVLNSKKRAWQKWRESVRKADKKQYKLWESKAKKDIRRVKNAVEKRVAKESRNNPKLFFSYIISIAKGETNKN